MKTKDLDLDARYVDKRGMALRILEVSKVRVAIVGDDDNNAAHEVDISDLEKIDPQDHCEHCGHVYFT